MAVVCEIERAPSCRRSHEGLAQQSRDRGCERFLANGRDQEELLMPAKTTTMCCWTTDDRRALSGHAVGDDNGHFDSQTRRRLLSPVFA